MKAFRELKSTVVFLAALVAISGPPTSAEPRALFDLEALDCVIDPSQVSDLGSGVPGLLRAVQVDRSDFVTAGQVVAQLDSGVETAAVALAKARAELTAEVDLRRVNAAFGKRQEARSDDLFRKQVISENDMDQRQTETRIAQLQLLQARDNQRLAAMDLTRAEEVLQRRTIRTPISGVVMERFKSAGEYVDEQPVLRVAQLDPLHVEVILPVEVLGQVEPGMQAEVWSEAVSDQVWHAEVSRIDRVADAASGTYGVRLILPNPDYQIPAGLRCQMRFIRPEAPKLSDAGKSIAPEEQASGEGVMHPTLGETDKSVALNAQQPHNNAEQGTNLAALVDPEAAPPKEIPRCRMLGPIEDRTQAEQLVAQLTAVGVEVTTLEETTESVHGFQVVSAAQPSFAKAKSLENRLRAAGIEDTAIMREQGVRWLISLGLYRFERHAQARIEQLADKGIEATLKPWKKKASVFVLAVSGTLDEQAAELIKAVRPFAAERPRSCSQLASR